jgi:hypothetical protein
MIQNHDLRVTVDDIMDVFAGADGGVTFVQFCVFINRMDEMAKKGDKQAQQVLEDIRRFRRLLNIIAKN